MRLRAGLAVLAIGWAASLTGCSLGTGEGELTSEALLAKDCWEAGFSLDPDFFAALPSLDSVSLRLQRGSDIQEVADGALFVVSELERVRTEWLGVPLPVRLPAGVVPPGSVPAPCDADCQTTPRVSFALYLHRSCHNQNVVLYAVDGTITFDALFSGDPAEQLAADKLTSAAFDLTVADPRDVPLGGMPSDIPPEVTSRVSGWFEFYFERGEPAQPFP